MYKGIRVKAQVIIPVKKMLSAECETIICSLARPWTLQNI